MKVASRDGEIVFAEDADSTDAKAAEAALQNGIQGISDGTLTLYDGDIRPRGSIDAGFVHTNWGRVTKGPGLWNDAYETTRWLVAWSCAFRLEVLRRC